MLSRQLINFLQESRNKGTPFEDVEALLRAEKSDENTILEAKNWYATTPSAQSSVSSQVFVSEEVNVPNNSVPEKKKLKLNISKKKLFLVLIFVVLFIVLTFFTTSVLIAYDKLALGNLKFKGIVSNFVIGLPFMPKTPEYVLYKAVKKQEDVKSFFVDASMAMSSNDFSGMLGGGNLDLVIKGPVDYRDQNNPFFSFNLYLTKDFNMDLLLKNKIMYFKINKIPPSLDMVMAYAGITNDKQAKLKKDWFYYDMRTLETEARKNLEANSTDELFWQKTEEKLLEAMEKKKLKLDYTMTRERVDSFSTYKISAKVSKELIDIFEEVFMTSNASSSRQSDLFAPPKLSDSIENMNVSYWVDSENYYIRKISMSFVINPETSSLSNSAMGSYYGSYNMSDIPVSIVIKLYNFGQSVNVIVPKNAVRAEEFFKSLMEGQKLSTESASMSAIFNN